MKWYSSKVIENHDRLSIPKGLMEKMEWKAGAALALYEDNKVFILEDVKSCVIKDCICVEIDSDGYIYLNEATKQKLDWKYWHKIGFYFTDNKTIVLKQEQTPF